jgi:uncharacterized membrane protein YgdD (TMEM256/DUF423 family)
MGLVGERAIGVRGLRVALGWAGLLGLTAVAAGAFGAHGVADPRAKAWLQTGGEYGMVHALAALAALSLARSGAKLAHVAAWLFLAGATVFSASLYLMALSGRLWLGAVTPIGGVLLLAGWACLAWSGFAFSET